MIRHFRVAKYNNKSSHCRSGHYHQSVFEAQYCDKLLFLARAGEISSYACQVPFILNVNGEKICTHVVDFVVHTKEGKEEVHEVKGYATDVWQIKWKLFKAIYPDITYHVITKDYRYDPRNKYYRKR